MIRSTSIFLTILLITIAGLSLAILYVKGKYESPYVKVQKDIIIPKGVSAKKIGDILYNNDLIPEVIHKLFPYILEVADNDKNMQSGEYAISYNMSPKQIVNKISSGDNIMHKITFPEGETVFMALQRIKNHEKLTGEITSTPTEGTLEANSFLFSNGMTRESLIQKMIGNQKKHIDDAWQKRPLDLPIKNKEELLILASIIEKETAMPSERTLVASVFINRLNKSMRLQTDPTIIYGITKGKSSLGRPIYRSDIQRDTGYNTYQIDGLPPTPICNPGKASIDAVITAPKTEYLYFVANGKGGHNFSKTLKEHQENVKKWRQIESGRSDN